MTEMTDLLFLDKQCQAADFFFFSPPEKLNCWLLRESKPGFWISQRETPRQSPLWNSPAKIHKQIVVAAMCSAGRRQPRFQSRCESRGEKTKDLCRCSFLKHYVGTTVQAPLLFTVKKPRRLFSAYGSD